MYMYRASQTYHLQASRSNSGINLGTNRISQYTAPSNASPKDSPRSSVLPKPTRPLIPRQSLQKQHYVAHQPAQQPKSLFRTVDTTYLKMTGPKAPEKKPWAQPENFVPLDIPKARQVYKPVFTYTNLTFLLLNLNLLELGQ